MQALPGWPAHEIAGHKNIPGYDAPKWRAWGLAVTRPLIGLPAGQDRRCTAVIFCTTVGRETAKAAWEMPPEPPDPAHPFRGGCRCVDFNAKDMSGCGALATQYGVIPACESLCPWCDLEAWI